MRTKEQLLKDMIELNEAITKIERSLRFNAENPFSMQWNDTNATVLVGLSEERSKKHKANKIKLAKSFLAIIKTELKEVESQLKKQLK